MIRYACPELHCRETAAAIIERSGEVRAIER